MISGMKQIALALICLIIVTGKLSGQNKVIDLWNGKVPGAIFNANFKQTVDFADNWIKMRFVTDPVLDVYPAPAEKGTGTAVVICSGGGYWGLAIDHEGKKGGSMVERFGDNCFRVEIPAAR